MNLQQLFSMQRELDQHIIENHGLEKEDLFDRKILALLVELGELANETRCFKFWSVKGPSKREVILEEFVDGIHFILSLGLERGFEKEMTTVTRLENGATETSAQFLNVYTAVEQLKDTRSLLAYQALFSEFLRLGEILGFKSREIEEAYVKKNEVNFARQANEY